MKKLDLKKFMEKSGNENVSTPPKLAKRIGELSDDTPTDVTVWGWVNRDRKPMNKQWIKALATIFKVEHGEQFFLS